MTTCLVTGASGGIGFETCVRLVEEGCLVIAVSRSEKGLDELVDKCGDLDGELHAIRADLTTEIESIARQVSEVCGSLNILVNNAGYLVNKPFTEISDEDLLYIYKVNLMAPFQLIQACMTLLESAQWSHVVNIGSVGGVAGSAKFPGLAAYSSSKGALNILTECLAEEYKETDIRFNGLSLGAVQTAMLEEAFPGYQAPIDAEGMSEYISRFALEDWKHINGKIISVSTSTP